ncbi:O-antigen ligase family protein [Flavobacterium caeni]|uniref:O-antigen ligase family protein n=1 Tax=Flavobacterium caeni TaxID=490189 RepID=UPI000B8588A4|nr:O-antigen ligase family protein [Flavobacterium caeni]
MKSTFKYLPKYGYPLLVLLHVALGALLFWLPEIGVYYGPLAAAFGLLLIVKNKDQNHEVLFAAAYLTGAEVLIRIMGGSSYELAKYSVAVYVLFGLFFSGFSKKSWLYVAYLLLLVPSILISEGLTGISKSTLVLLRINLNGPICLGLLAIYAFDKKISFGMLSRILLLVSLPALSIAVLVFLHSPAIDSIQIVDSNKYFSAMFGPNQVATTLGLGMFLFFARAILFSESYRLLAFNLVGASFMAYVGLLTFSRGGMIVGVCTTLAMILFVYLRSGSYGKWRAKMGLLAFAGSFMTVVTVVAIQTDGLIIKRYTNQDHLGRTKRIKEGDRLVLATKEMNLFFDNSFAGVGVTKAEDARKSKSGRNYHTHNEITRLLGEHGLMGLGCVVILIGVPIWLFLKRRRHVLLGVFFVFWFLSVNHISTRMLASAFFYALMLLQIDLAPNNIFDRIIVRDSFRKKLVPVTESSSI